jgi:hypothetical protein
LRSSLHFIGLNGSSFLETSIIDDFRPMSVGSLRTISGSGSFGPTRYICSSPSVWFLRVRMWS